MPVTQALTASSSAPPETTRLHITPFNPSLLKTYIPPSLLPLTTAVSYHSVQTFPDKGFGYVEMPAMEAQKIKKKFNGSILKGSKVHIEDARPEKRKRVLDTQVGHAGAEEQDAKAGKSVKKVKRKDGVLLGFELPKERRVKRAWTEPEGSGKVHKKKDPKDKEDKKNKSQPSKYTTGPELLFKTALPSNALPTPKSDKGVEKPKKSKKSSRDVVVHEFSKTTKHATFLKSNQLPKDAKATTEYVEGRGWVDEEGNVVEPESDRRRRRREEKAKVEAERKRVESASANAKKASSKSSERKTALQLAEALEAKRNSAKAASPAEGTEIDDKDVSDDSSSVISSSSSNVSSSSEEVESEDSDGTSSSDAESNVVYGETSDKDVTFQSTSTTDGVEMTDVPSSPQDAGAASKEVHPLEALFKRPNPPEGDTPTKLAPINTSFSFFGGDVNDEDDENDVVEKENSITQPPLTPYTRQDMRVRGIRSAAPTPDTAAIGKKFPFPWRDEDEEDEDDEEVEDSMLQDANSVPLGAKAGGGTQAAAGEEGEQEQSEFAKHFWEHRGEYNRAWKKRRRESLKVKRQRENRRLGRRVV